MGYWGKYIGNKPTMRQIKERIKEETQLSQLSVRFGYAVGIVTEDCIGDDGYKPDALGIIIVCKWFISQGQLMIKTMSEDMGPYYNDVPLKYLNTPCKHANESWRANCINAHIARRERRKERRTKYENTIQ